MKAKMPLRRPPTIHSRQEPLDILLTPKFPLQPATAELQLIGKMRRNGLDESLQGDVFPRGCGKWHADAEDVRD